MSKTIVGIRFKKAGKIYHFDPVEIPLNAGDGVIVETVRGVEYGTVAVAPHEAEEQSVTNPLKKIIRKATEEDLATIKANRAKEQEAFGVCEQKITDHKLDMKLVDVEFTFDCSKLLFYFTAEGRVDFRELVKDLAHHFRTRIELRQIGVRDETKMMGGIGKCGMELCCCQFLGEFVPVSIKMAKEQNISLNPTKISGLCGRLMCCLNYEQEYYEHMRKLMPPVGSEIQTKDGKGFVIDNNAIKGIVRARITLADGTLDVRVYPYADVQLLKNGIPAKSEEHEQIEGDKEELKTLLSEEQTHPEKG
jgi:cell fate regulator YaaT (PSP1 superfamily)